MASKDTLLHRLFKLNEEEANELEEELRCERERSVTLSKAIGELAGQIIELGGDPIGEDYVE